MMKDCFQWVKTKKIIGLFEDELDGKIIAKFVGLRAKTYAYLTDDGSKHKKAKGMKKCVIKRRLMFLCLMIKSY